VTGEILETIRVREGRVPLLERHAARLAAACTALGVPHPAQSLADLVGPWLPRRESVVRVEVGASGVSVTTRAVPAAATWGVHIAATPHRPYPWKVTERTAFEAALAEALAAGADDALLLTADGMVAEGTAWSMFWWEGEHAVTPPLRLGILPGVARGRVMELVPVVELECRPSDVAWRGAFATNAARGIVPIGRVDGVPVPADQRTARLAERFWPG
jgi:branched-chain amino acid aminotransferase